MALHLMRHPPPKAPPGLCYGASDLELAAPFDVAIVDTLPRFDRLVTSPLGRCRLPATAIGASLGLAVTVDPRLREMDFGAWEGRPWSAIPRAELDLWAEDFLHAAPHGGETVAALAARVHAALDDQRACGGDALILTHAGVIKAALWDWRRETPFGAVVTL